MLGIEANSIDDTPPLPTVTVAIDSYSKTAGEYPAIRLNLLPLDVVEIEDFDARRIAMN